MASLIEFNRPIIEQIYSQTNPNQPLNLGDLEVQITFNEKVYQYTASFDMQFMPDDQLLITIPFIDKDSTFFIEVFHGDKWDGKIKLTEPGIHLDTFFKFGTFGSYGKSKVILVPKTSVIQIIQPSNSISSAVFHLFNFPQFYGPEDYIFKWEGGTKRCGKITLNANGWVITISATDKTDDIIKLLESQGGYAITHMGKITREDGSTFSSKELEEIIQCVYYFLSFALGRWAGIAFPIGYDNENRKVFEQWGLPLVSAGEWNNSLSWFDSNHSELISQVFPGFMTLWKNEIWKDALCKSIYWYLAANERTASTGVDTGLIIAQTAIEHIAWTHCIKDRKMVSPKAFSKGGLSAADRIRLLASSLGIPLQIPENMSALHARRGSKWEDIPHSITAIRNAIVHPSENISLPNGSFYEAWIISMWFLDLTLLCLCNHQGCYSDRITKKWVGTLEKVPWIR